MNQWDFFSNPLNIALLVIDNCVRIHRIPRYYIAGCMKLIRLFILLALAPLFVTCHRHQEHLPTPEQIAAEKLKNERVEGFLKAYEKLFAEQLSKAGCPGAAVAIVVDSSIVWTKGFGIRAASTGQPVDEHTLFRLGSLSKGVTSVLVSKLVHQGKMSWGDHVKEYIHSFTMADTGQAGRVSIAHLLSHSTGLPRHTFTDLIEGGLQSVDIVDRLSKVPLIGKEGKAFAYQNFAFSLIENIVQQKTATSFVDLLRNEIFQPAAMLDANTNFEQYVASGNYAHPHRAAKSGGFIEMPLNEKYYNAVSAGGINASIADMSHWLQLLMGQYEEIVTDSMLSDVFTPVVNTGNENRFRAWDGLKESYYGYGWRIMELSDRKVMYHGGSVNDFRTEIAIDPVSGVGICVMFNGQNNLAGHVVPDFLELWKKAMAEEAKDDAPEAVNAAQN